MEVFAERRWTHGCRRVVRWLLPAATMAALASLAPAVALAQTNAPSGREVPPRATGAPRPTINAVRAGQPPAIDGRLTEDVWRTAAHIDRFVQQIPVEGAPATEKTDVYIAYDSERLYFGIYAHYSEPGLVRANRVDRDKTDNDDTLVFSFDPFLDQQQGYAFSVNGYGVQGDAVLKGGPLGGTGGVVGDTSWNALFASAGQLVEDGWTAELAIPFKSLRYPARGPGEAHRWGFQIERQIKTKNETAHWAPLSRDVSGFLRQMGVLGGITNLSTSRNLEILPSFTAVQGGTLNKTTGVYTTQDVEEGGLNVKYGVTSNLTFDATYNPDFSQIESDTQQIQVNLRYPISFAELRPFFLEGQDIFRVFAPAQMVHTRTIVDPQFGAKLTGKVGKTTVALVVANDEAPGKVDDAGDPAFGRTAQVVLGRARYDFRPETSVGALFTDREFLDGHNRLFSVDGAYRLGRTHRVVGSAVISEHQSVGGAQKTGHFFDVNVRKEGRHVIYFAAYHHLNPDFQADLGFVRRVGYKESVGNITYKWWPERWLINWGPQFNYDRIYDYKGILQNTGPGVKVDFQFAKNITLSTTVDHDLERYREVDFTKNRFSVSGSVAMSRRISFTAKIDKGDEIRFTANPFLGRNTLFTATATFRPISRLQSDVRLNTTTFIDVRSETQVFDVKILRVMTTYQFTPRLLIRNIMQRNTFDKTLDANVLVTYRVNSGTAFYVGYDDHYAQGSAVNAKLFAPDEFQRTNRAVFTKLQYLFRMNSR